ncbi:DUF6053 domain-containing protein [Lysobacter capsici]|uniref:DUF6053 domain-containing protein n=1 Tax=Lysobacter capsici TaxID=435897 RepID=UPI003D2F80BD
MWEGLQPRRFSLGAPRLFWKARCFAANGTKSVGAEAPPTRAGPALMQAKLRPRKRHACAQKTSVFPQKRPLCQRARWRPPLRTAAKSNHRATTAINAGNARTTPSCAGRCWPV